MATESLAKYVGKTCIGFIVNGVPSDFSFIGPQTKGCVSRVHDRTLPDSSVITLSVLETTFMPYADRVRHPQYSLMVDLSTDTGKPVQTVTFVFVSLRSLTAHSVH